jgi:hypothetical protein
MPDNVIHELVAGWVRHFQSADRELTWVGAEEEASLWLTPNTLLMGRLDARGITANGERFFGEWKTANPRERNSWKNVWRLNPQSLTYGLLADALDPGCRRFTVRKAFKSSPPSYDHAWFTYSDNELAMWKREVTLIADEIRMYQAEPEGSLGKVPWPLNLSNCFRYGEKNVCPFFHTNCNRQDWTTIAPGITPRIPHLDTERRLNAPEVVALDATRIKTWLDCRERFRRTYVENVDGPPSEALQLGIDFHQKIGEYYVSLICTR